MVGSDRDVPTNTSKRDQGYSRRPEETQQKHTAEFKGWMQKLCVVALGATPQRHVLPLRKGQEKPEVDENLLPWHTERESCTTRRSSLSQYPRRFLFRSARPIPANTLTTLQRIETPGAALSVQKHDDQSASTHNVSKMPAALSVQKHEDRQM